MDAPKHQTFNGQKFTRDERTGYYLGTRVPRKRMHVYVWEFYYGPVPEGYHIHHKDGNRANNSIENLEALPGREHEKLHSDMLTDEQRQWRRDNMNQTARPAAIEWHRSEAGREWHKQHYEEMGDRMHERHTDTCLYCGKEFSALSNSKFCSNACKSAYRRKAGVDDVERECPICGKLFRINKYRKTKTCSRSCANVLWHRQKVS